MSAAEQEQALGAWLALQSQAERVTIDAQKRLGGGAVQDNRLLEVSVEGGPLAGRHRWVLRSDAAAPLAISASREEEFALLHLAWRHGIQVPEPLWLCSDDSVLNRPFMIMRHVSGETSPRALVDSLSAEPAEALVEALGAELARIHALPVTDIASKAGSVHASRTEDVIATQLTDFHDRLAQLGQPQPVMEWALRWLETHRPALQSVVLAHNDFRIGNLMIENGELAAVLDWEFAGPNAPLADIGWFCAPCWRFGGRGEAGGVGSLDGFLRGYERICGYEVDRHQIDWWIILATLRWAVIALEQGARHASGAQPDLELALTAHLLPGLELDLLRLIPIAEDISPTDLPRSIEEAQTNDDNQMPDGSWAALNALNDDTRDLLEITRQTLKSDIIPALEGDVRHSALMIANALSIIARQQHQGESIWHQVRAQLAHDLSLPEMPDDPQASARQLVTEIRSGARDAPECFEALRHLLREDALARARISQPRAAKMQ